MCGRFTITLSKDDFIRYLSKYKQLEINIDDITLPNYNVAPTENIAAMIKYNDSYRVGPLKWGFIPSFASDTKKIIINARSETILEKALFKDSVFHKRCVIFADSFYEWKSVDGRKIPYRIMIKDKKMFAFAGLWSHYKKDGQSLYTAVILTTKANKLMADIHDRMPVILGDDQIDAWLNAPFIEESHIKILASYPSELMYSYKVSPYVNSSTHKDQKCIKQIKST
jgi:putative SOS response-associated peptidase YedK